MQLIRTLMMFVVVTFGATYSDTHTAATCSQTHVQAAINAASDGDTVKVPAGSCTWNTDVSIIGKTLILQGAGSGAGGTRITHGGSNHTLVSIDVQKKTGRLEVSGFWFSGNDPDNWNGTAMQFWGPKDWKNLRIHHNVFDGNHPWTMKGYSGICGLIDHNTFQGSAYGILLYGDAEKDWVSPLVLGTADFFFIEDNTFNWNDFYGNTKSPTMDMDAGGRQVFRKNVIVNGMWETHDKARSGLVSANAYEIYQNSFSTTTQQHKGLDISAGTGVVWGNFFSGPVNIPIGGMDYKSFDPRSCKLCDGTDPADQNVPGESGWRCQYQIGTQGEGPTAYSYPLYLWNNRANGNLVGMSVTSGQGDNHVKSGRDYINNGSTPKTGYTPFTYPHPLQGNVTGIARNDRFPVSASVGKFTIVTASMVGWDLSHSAHVSLDVCDFAGKQVGTLVNSTMAGGSHRFDLNRHQLTCGIYLLRLTVGRQSDVRRISIMH